MPDQPTLPALREEQRPARSNVPAEITAMLQQAIERGVGVEALEKLVALHERVTDRIAASEFSEDLAAFQSECPPVPKKSVAKVVSKRTGTSFTYRYAELPEIAAHIAPYLHHRGFSYSWDTEVTDRTLSATCTLRHRNGHSATARFGCPVEDTGGRMSHAQETAAALTYAKRQSLIQVLGLTTCEEDTDASRKPQSGDPITESQAADIHALIEEVDADEARFLRYIGAESVETIPAASFDRAVKALQSKRR